MGVPSVACVRLLFNDAAPGYRGQGDPMPQRPWRRAYVPSNARASPHSAPSGAPLQQPSSHPLHPGDGDGSGGGGGDGVGGSSGWPHRR